MLIMSIPTPQQDIGVRVSLPLESHHIDSIIIEAGVPVFSHKLQENERGEK